MAAIYIPVLILIIAKVSQETADNEDFFGMVFTVIMMLITAVFIIRMSTVTVLSPREISFREYPFTGSLTSLNTDDIESLSFQKHKWWYGYGYRYSFSGTKVLAMKPGVLLKVVTKKGKTYLLGINREKLVQRFIEEEWPNIPFYGQ